MKKGISIGFLLLANIVLLAHAFIPHHHHEGVVVAIFDNHCAENSDNHDHDHDWNHGDNPHKHENKSASEQCALNEVYTRADNSSKVVSPINWDCGETLLFILPGIIDKLGLADEVGLPFRQKPYIESYHVIFSSNSLGLRAPPVC